MDWLTLLATVAGGSAALLGTLIAHALASREDRRRENSAERRSAYVDFLVALDAAHGTLRKLADPDDPPADLEVQARRVLGEARVYETREKLLLVGNPAVLGPSQRVLERLSDMRKAVRDGAKLYSIPYHDAYHRYAEALWHLRAAIRKDTGAAAIAPADLDKETWDSQATCEFCRKNKLPAQPAPVA